MKIFISGVTKGLGLYLAKEFIVRQDTVWGIGRGNLEKETLDFTSDRFVYSQCDTTSCEQIKNTFNEMLKSGFLPDIAVFCAGSATEDVINDNFIVDKFKSNFNVNLFGVLNWIELFLPYFRKRNKGVFVGISSMSIYRENHRKRIGYSASKLSLNKSFENLQLEHLNTGIKFSLFNMGRMSEKKEFIGISYAKGAALIVKIIKSSNLPRITNMPFLQWVLTMMTTHIPDVIYYKFFYK